MPQNFCRKVRPFELESEESAKENARGSTYIACTIEAIPWQELEARGPFQGVLLDPPWNELTCARLMEYIKLTATLIPAGFVFLWVEKEYLARALKVLKRWKFEYVENMVWVQRQANNEIRKDNYSIFNRSKLTMLICRRGKGGIELRHQRNPDVWFEPMCDIKLDAGGARVAKPPYVYQMIETLLPDANVSDKVTTGGLLEIWAPKNEQRKSWTSIRTWLPRSRVAMSKPDSFALSADLIASDENRELSLSQEGLSQIEIVEEVFRNTQLADAEAEYDEDQKSQEAQEEPNPALRSPVVECEYDSELWFD